MDIMAGCFVGQIEKHEWSNVMLKELINWERISVDPNSDGQCLSLCQPQGASKSGA